MRKGQLRCSPQAGELEKDVESLARITAEALLFPLMSDSSSFDPPALPFLSSSANPPLSAMALNTSANTFLAAQAFWGPVTATLDWCEVSGVPAICFAAAPEPGLTRLPRAPLPG